MEQGRKAGPPRTPLSEQQRRRALAAQGSDGASAGHGPCRCRGESRPGTATCGTAPPQRCSSRAHRANGTDLSGDTNPAEKDLAVMFDEKQSAIRVCSQPRQPTVSWAASKAAQPAGQERGCSSFTLPFWTPAEVLCTVLVKFWCPQHNKDC